MPVIKRACNRSTISRWLQKYRQDGLAAVFEVKTAPGRMAKIRGVKPVAAVEWQRENYWNDGVVEPFSGWYFTAEHERLDSKQFLAFLDALSIQLGEDVALIQLDQAKVH